MQGTQPFLVGYPGNFALGYPGVPEKFENGWFVFNLLAPEKIREVPNGVGADGV